MVVILKFLISKDELMEAIHPLLKRDFEHDMEVDFVLSTEDVKSLNVELKIDKEFDDMLEVEIGVSD